MANSPTNGNGMPEFDFAHDPTWRIFRIMAEFVDGFTFLADIPKSVTIFGSARLAEDSPYYIQARTLAGKLAERNYTVVTGGGPGIMEGANQGAFEAGGESVGLNIQLPNEQRINPYVKKSMSFNYFFSRKTMLTFSAEAYIFFPGGYGTLDEFFDLVTAVQTGKHARNVPILMIGKAYWEPLTTWMHDVLQEQLHTISESDMKIWTLIDDIDEAVKLVEAGVASQTEEWVKQKGHARKTPNDKLKQATRPMVQGEQ